MKHLLSIFGYLAVLGTPAYAIDCASLSQKECYHSKLCSLDCDQRRPDRDFCANGYICRDKLRQCEIGLPQAELTEENCAARSYGHFTCALKRYPCFCGIAVEGQGECACGGGFPPACRRVT